ncbi:hypothetical protein GGR56DRAFT_670049 [Xylariaceae sp. FL0804]|nr:hypothetical protein GGR56DRAFT_670049 [Xylariaceae sp. FL0804]
MAAETPLLNETWALMGRAEAEEETPCEIFLTKDLCCVSKTKHCNSYASQYEQFNGAGGAIARAACEAQEPAPAVRKCSAAALAGWAAAAAPPAPLAIKFITKTIGAFDRHNPYFRTNVAILTCICLSVVIFFAWFALCIWPICRGTPTRRQKQRRAGRRSRTAGGAAAGEEEEAGLAAAGADIPLQDIHVGPSGYNSSTSTLVMPAPVAFSYV